MGSLLASLPIFQGKKPKVPDWNDVSLAVEQGKAIDANQKALPAAEKLARSTDEFNQAELERMLEQAMPGYQNILNKQKGLIESQLRGEIPLDVQQQIQRQTAYGALKGGFGGSEMGRNLTARDLGITSLNITNNAIDSATRWMNQTAALRTPGRFDVTSMFVTPGQMFAATFQNQQQKFERDVFAAKIAAAPEPWAAHMGQTLDSIADTALSVAAAYGGGQGGGGKTDASKAFSSNSVNYGGGGGGGGGMSTMSGGNQTFSSSGGAFEGFNFSGF